MKPLDTTWNGGSLKMKVKTKLKSLIFLLALLIGLSFSSQAEARQGWVLGVQVSGSIFLTNAVPDMDPGPGFGIDLQYRFNQRWALETNLSASFHDGRDAFENDSGIFLSLPTAELKLYLFGQESKVEPYVLAGLGIYVLTEGALNNNTGGVGLGGTFGAGLDYYLSDRFSLGFAAKFRPTALIQGNGASTGLINFATIISGDWHF
ncbi:MAG: outer membrane beta-barrel protein [Deltaproteobacteria bacterium]|nr:outer membrane beta-barrel protein [Deltaproteobacteria bacterium]